MRPIDLLLPSAPWLQRLPVSRDQCMLLIAAVGEIGTGCETYLAHKAGGALRGAEWIPLVFGPAAGLVLLLAGLLAFRRRMLASVLATVVFAASIVVGVLGAYFHVLRAILPSAPVGQRVALDLFFWAPPVLGPLAFALIGVFGTSAAWVEDPPDSGRLVLPGGLHVQLPYAKTQAYFYITGMGIMIALISATFDHANTGFRDPWLWLPVGGGVFAVVVAALLGMIDRPTRGDLLTYVAAMVLLIVVGVVGASLHIKHDLTAGGVVVLERFLRGAPVLAPLLFTTMGMMGLAALLPEKQQEGGVLQESGLRTNS
jgi:hypothetical protein